MDLQCSQVRIQEFSSRGSNFQNFQWSDLHQLSALERQSSKQEVVSSNPAVGKNLSVL